MASRVLSRAWKGLQARYRFPGQLTAPNELELGLPVQPVACVSRMSELATSLIAVVTDNTITDGIGTPALNGLSVADLFGLATLTDRLAGIGRRLDNTTVWLHSIYVGTTVASAANFNNCSVGINASQAPGFFSPDGTGGTMPVWFSNTVDQRFSGGGLAGPAATVFTDTFGDIRSGRWVSPIKLPYPIRSYSSVTSDGAAGAVTGIVISTFSFCPIDADPPHIYG